METERDMVAMISNLEWLTSFLTRSRAAIQPSFRQVQLFRSGLIRLMAVIDFKMQTYMFWHIEEDTGEGLCRSGLRR